MRQPVRRLLVTFVMGLSLLGLSAGASVAQDTADVAHPSHLHAGTCADLDPDPAYPLADVAPVAAEGETGSVKTGMITLDVSLDDLLASPFALNVHESAVEIGTYIACGEVTGPVVDGTLMVALREQGGSGYSGIAIFTPAASGGTDVAVYLGHGLSSETEATPEASPVAAEAVAVSILDYSFDGEVVEVPVGTTVTWTNDGQVIHTATSTDGLWDSAILDPGGTYSYTFEEAGSFDYLCSLHPKMVGTIVVTEL